MKQSISLAILLLLSAFTGTAEAATNSEAFTKIALAFGLSAEIPLRLFEGYATEAEEDSGCRVRAEIYNVLPQSSQEIRVMVTDRENSTSVEYRLSSLVEVTTTISINAESPLQIASNYTYPLGALALMEMQITSSAPGEPLMVMVSQKKNELPLTATCRNLSAFTDGG